MQLLNGIYPLLSMGLFCLPVVVTAMEPHQDEIKHLRDTGVVLSLEEVLNRAGAGSGLPGKIVEVALQQRNGSYVYELKVLGKNGELKEIVLEAGIGNPDTSVSKGRR